MGPGLDRSVGHDAIHDRWYGLTDHALVTLGRHEALHFGDALEPFALQLVRHVVRQVERARTFLRRVGENPDAVELHLFQEVEELLEVVVDLAREPHDDRGADGNSRDSLADLAELFALPRLSF